MPCPRGEVEVMTANRERYRWWLLDRDLCIVLDGSVTALTLHAALGELSREIDAKAHNARVARKPYSLIVYRGAAVVAVRPSTLGVC
jgi:hypothetical protein